MYVRLSTTIRTALSKYTFDHPFNREKKTVGSHSKARVAIGGSGKGELRIVIVIAVILTIAMIAVTVRLIDQTSSHVAKVQKTRVRLQSSANFTPEMNAVEKQIRSDLKNRKNMKAVSYGKMELTKRCFVDIGKMQGLRNLDLSDSDFQSEWFDELVGSNLYELNVMNTDFSDIGMESIAKIKSLTRLNAKFTTITDKGLLFFRGHPSLYELKVDFADVTNEGADSIAAMPNVGQLELVGTKIDGPGIASVAKLPQLKSISVGGRFVTLKAADIRPLKDAKNLVTIQFDSFSADDEFMQELSTFKNLESIALVRIPMTEAGFMKLKAMKRLIHIKVDRCSTVTQAMIDNLRKQMKKCLIEYRTQEQINAST
jgi:hypothetical protein